MELVSPGDVSRGLEDLGGSGDGAGVDLEILGELLVGELEDTLAEADPIAVKPGNGPYSLTEY